jgi:hypothetical protein
LFPCARKALEGRGRFARPNTAFSYEQPSLSDAVVTSLLRHGRVIFFATRGPPGTQWLSISLALIFVGLIMAAVMRSRTG